MPSNEAQREMWSLVTARVRDAGLTPPLVVDGSTDLVTLCRQMSQRGLSQALVNDGAARQLGIFSTEGLRDALLHALPPQRLAVREVADFAPVEVAAEADLFEAQWLMLRHRVQHLVVRDGDAVLGILGAHELLRRLAGHSHVAALQIDAATDLAALQAAARLIDEAVVQLHGVGVAAERIARLVGELNARLMTRLWTLLAPPGLVSDAALLVMGSEGRGEQILKTDQDNALLLREGVDAGALQGLADDFSAALAQLGYPPCPGRIMVSNPLWRQPLPAFRDTLRGWLYDGTLDGPMHLAIFMDARCVAGDPTLLGDARAHLQGLLHDDDAFAARFAAAADRFPDPGHWLARLAAWVHPGRDDPALDIKKTGIFPIVHGVRALALQQGLTETGTAVRLARLAQAGALDAALARDLADALHLLMQQRLGQQLRQRADGGVADNLLQPAAMSTLEREALHDALAIVHRFRLFLRQHFRLDS